MVTRIIRFLYLLLFLVTPLLMSSATSELFEFNKMIFIYGIAISVLAFWLTDLIIYKKKIYQFTLFTAVVGLFLLSQIFSTIFSIDPHTSLFGYYGRFNGGLYSIISYIILFFGFINYYDTTSFLKLLKGSVIASVLVILWGLPGKFGYDLSCFAFIGQLNNNCWTDQFRPAERMFSTLGQPNWLGAYLAIHFFIGLYFVLSFISTSFWGGSASERRRLQNPDSGQAGMTIVSLSFYSLYTLLTYISILFTKSRSAVGAVLVGAVLFPLVIVCTQRKMLHRRFILFTAVLGVTLFIPLVILKTGIVSVDKYLSFAPNLPPASLPSQPAPAIQETGITNSIDIRKIVWQGAQELGKRYPVWGTGVETFAYSYYFVRPQAHNMTSEWDYLYNKAHNEFLNYFATTGYFGLISYLLVIAVTFALGIRLLFISKDKNLIVSCLLAYLSILITNFFGFSTTTVNIFFYLIPGIFIVLWKKQESTHHVIPDLIGDPVSLDSRIRGNDKSNSIFFLSYIQIAFIGLVILVTGYLFFYLARYYEADIKYAASDRYSHSNDYQTAANMLQEALNLHNEHVYEDKLSYVLANLSYVAAYQKEQDIAKKLVTLAVYYNQNSLKQSPQNILYWKTTIKNDYLFYQITLDSKYITNGLAALATAAKIAPTDPKIPYSAASFYSILEDEEQNPQIKTVYQDKSMQAIDTSIQLKPDFKDAYLLKGQLLKKYNRALEAKQVFEYILKNISPGDEEVKKELQSL